MLIWICSQKERSSASPRTHTRSPNQPTWLALIRQEMRFGISEAETPNRVYVCWGALAKQTRSSHSYGANGNHYGALGHGNGGILSKDAKPNGKNYSIHINHTVGVQSVTTSHKTFSLSKPVGNERIPLEAIAYFRARNRNNAYHTVICEFQDSGLSQATVARRLGKRPEIISRLLGAPGNWTLDTVSDLLFAISGAESKYGLSYPLEKPVRNDTQPEWLSPPQTLKKLVDKQGPKAKSGVGSVVEANAQNAKPLPLGQEVAGHLGRTHQSATHRPERTKSTSKSLLEMST